MKIVLDYGAVMPERAHPTDAGLDLFTPGTFILKGKARKEIDTGVHVQIPAGFVGFLTSKSGLMAKGVTSTGTIDSGYTGSIRAVMYNHSEIPIIFERGQKITQLVLVPILTPELEVVEKLEDTDRGAGGFGSTGK